MELPSHLQNRLIEFLVTLPNMQNSEARQALVASAGLDAELLRQIGFFGKPPAQFFTLLVTTLRDYGNVSDGRHALEAMLSAARKLVGTDRQAECDALLDELRSIPRQAEQHGVMPVERRKRFMKSGLMALLLAFLGIGVAIWLRGGVVPPQPPSAPLFTIENPYLRPEHSVRIVAENAAARRKTPLYVIWDGLMFPNAAVPDSDPQTFRWTFELKQHVFASRDLQDGRHALQVGFAADALCPPIPVSINTEQPIVLVKSEASQAEPDAVKISGITASKLQDPQEILNVAVYFHDEGSRPSFSLPVERKLDDAGRIYFEFETKIEGLPVIAADDPRYAAKFFALEICDQAGNRFGYSMSYAQFIAPGSQSIKANEMADIQVKKDLELSAQSGKIAIIVTPPLTEFHGKPAIQLSAELRGTDLTQLTWVSELSAEAGHPVPTLVFRNERHLVTVVSKDRYLDTEAPAEEDVSYRVRQFDQDGQAYDSNVVRVPARQLIEPTTGMELVYVPDGCFQMGQTETEKQELMTQVGEEDYTKYYANELPRHEVCVEGFYIGKYEVTQAQWEAVMGSNPSRFTDADRPVEMVSWDNAQEFLKKLNAAHPSPLPRGEQGGTPLSGGAGGGWLFRLPSEAEWEYACRAGTQTAYSFGDDPEQLGNYAWHSENSNDETHPVGQKMPNAFGLHDMHGNVWEWVADAWHDNYDGAPTDGSAWEANDDSDWRALRGGSYYNGASEKQRCAVRNGDDWQIHRSDARGFRLVCSRRV